MLSSRPNYRKLGPAVTAAAVASSVIGVPSKAEARRGSDTWTGDSDSDQGGAGVLACLAIAGIWWLTVGRRGGKGS